MKRKILRKIQKMKKLYEKENQQRIEKTLSEKQIKSEIRKLKKYLEKKERKT